MVHNRDKLRRTFIIGCGCTAFTKVSACLSIENACPTHSDCYDDFGCTVNFKAQRSENDRRRKQASLENTISIAFIHLKYRIRQMGLEATTKALLDAGKARSAFRGF